MAVTADMESIAALNERSASFGRPLWVQAIDAVLITAIAGDPAGLTWHARASRGVVVNVASS